MKKFAILSKNTLKIIAAVSMALDHIGFVFFPDEEWLRIIGRLAFPIFAYSIYEGCKYTKNKGKYLLRVFVLGAVCFLAYLIYDRTMYFNVVISFSIAIVIIYGLQRLKKQLADREKNTAKLFCSCLWIVSSVAAAYLLCEYCDVDYGFWGIMLPVFAELFDIGEFTAEKTKGGNEKLLVFAGFAIGTLVLAFAKGGIQFYALFALLPIVFTGSRKGKLNMKYFFYIFYPLHLLVIEGIHYLIDSM